MKTAAVPLRLEDATFRGVLWQAAPGRFLLDLPDVARFLVEEGKRVTVDPSSTADEWELCRFARMTPLAALLYQRGMLALHAATVAAPKGGAILIAGDSGAGKSTLLAALLQRGWRFLGDDLAAVALQENGLPMVMPIYAELTLRPDAMEKLAFDGGHPGRRHLIKEENFIAIAQSLRMLYRLSVHKDGIEMAHIKGMKILDTLTKLSYNSRIADALFDRSAYLHLASVIARTVPVRSLRRPRGRWCADELADLVEKEHR
ncbi:MAG TPA: hypothetical protein VF799_02830 [Geobacteraceae bacterium]